MSTRGALTRSLSDNPGSSHTTVISDDLLDLDIMSQGFYDEVKRIEEESKTELSSSELQEDSVLSSLSEDQRKVYTAAVEGYSIFFTGDAGTGKSYVLRLIVSALKEKYGANRVFVTASTGIAACNIGGTTLHSFASIGLGDESITKCVHRVLQNKKAKKRWQECVVLIIDEISMLDGCFFDKLEAVSRRIRGDESCFGGIQIIACGDFFQLPPVGLGKNKVIYCFESECWNTVIQRTLIMTKVFRQKDEEFQALLRDIRYGKVSQRSRALLQKLERNELNTGKIVPTKLFALNESVDQYNTSALAQLADTHCITYKAIDEGQDIYLKQLQKNCQAPAVLPLKVGAQVMLLKNLSVEMGLVNGSRGVVDSFMKDKESEQEIPVVRFATGSGEVLHPMERKEFTIELGEKVVARRVQLPLKLAWGISIHKSQGMTIDLLDVDLHGVFEVGMTYVALSRGVSIDRMKLRNFSMRGIRTNPKVIAFYQRAAEPPKIPLPPPPQRFVPKKLKRDSQEVDIATSTDNVWLGGPQTSAPLPCSEVLKKPFSIPSKRVETEKKLDLEGWVALYSTPFKKDVEIKARNRFHTDLMHMAEEERDREKPHLPVENVQNALIFKRMAARRQLMGGVL